MSIMFEAFMDELAKIARAQTFKPTQRKKEPSQETKIKRFKQSPAGGLFRGSGVSKQRAREIITSSRRGAPEPFPTGAHKVKYPGKATIQ